MLTTLSKRCVWTCALMLWLCCLYTAWSWGLTSQWPSAFSINASFINKSVIVQTLFMNIYFLLWVFIFCWKTFSGRMLNTLDLTWATSLSHTPSYSHPQPLPIPISIHCYTHLFNTHHHSLILTLPHTHIPRALTTQRTHQMWETMLKVCGHQILNKRFRKRLPFIHPVVVGKSYSQMKGRCTVSWLNWS